MASSDRNNNGRDDKNDYVQAKRLIDEAMELLPTEEKSLYLKAVQESPFLFERNGESDPLKFMRFCDHDQWAAAKRLCLYWNERVFLFGQDRAFRPMTLTGDGALNRQDILFVESGSPALLPCLTKQGQPILYFDRRQWPRVRRPGYERVRALFYMMTVAAENYEEAHSTGVCNLYLMNTPRMIYHEAEILPIVGRAIKIMQNAMPIKFYGHILNFPPRSRHMYAVQETLTSFVEMCVQNGFELGAMEFCFEREKGDIYKHLTEELGMTRTGIPTMAGGTWTFVDAHQWCKVRFKHELEHHRSKLEQIRSEDVNAGVDGNENKTQSNTGSSPAPDALEDEETRLFKKRAANAVCSRRKRQRRQHEEKLLHGEHARLTKENFALKQEYARLVSLLEGANTLVEQQPLDHTAPPQDEWLMMPPPHQPEYQEPVSWMENPQPQARRRRLDEMALDNPSRFDAPDDILAYLGIR